ncbi:hypothetical protein L2E82_51984 [Cichorium intybus]|nr:hypothetical protein L2E82_51984 [Cichorium intybus]
MKNTHDMLSKIATNDGHGENSPYFDVGGFDSLGLGFDFASHFRLKFAKSCPDGGWLVELDESRKKDIVLPGIGATISGDPVNSPNSDDIL